MLEATLSRHGVKAEFIVRAVEGERYNPRTRRYEQISQLADAESSQLDAAMNTGSVRCQTNKISIASDELLSQLRLSYSDVPISDQLRSVVLKSCSYYIELSSMTLGHRSSGLKRVNGLLAKVKECETLTQLINIVIDFFSGNYDAEFGIRSGSNIGYKAKSFISYFLTVLRNSQTFEAVFESIDAKIVDFTRSDAITNRARRVMLTRITTAEFNRIVLGLDDK